MEKATYSNALQLATDFLSDKQLLPMLKLFVEWDNESAKAFESFIKDRLQDEDSELAKAVSGWEVEVETTF